MDQQGQRGELFKAIKISFLVSHDHAGQKFPSIIEWADFFSFFFFAQDLQRETTQFSFTGSKKVYQSGSF